MIVNYIQLAYLKYPCPAIDIQPELKYTLVKEKSEREVISPMPKIALYLQDGHSIVSFSKANMLLIYEKETEWRSIRTIPIDFSDAGNLSALRSGVRALITQLGDCSIIAGKSLTGIAYAEFDKAGFSIFDIDSVQPDTFDGILRDVAQSDQKLHRKEEMIRQARPVETATPGIYFLDLAALQTECPEISSKKALTDFLNSTPFLELHLVCRHLPPWLENAPLDIKTSNSGEQVTAVITKKQC